MGRQSNIVAIVAGVTAFASLASGQPQGQGHHAPAPAFRRPPPSSAFHGTVERWKTLSPEDRLIFRRNAERWMQMTPQERNVLRERERARTERLKREADEALRDAGLRLDEDKRGLYEQRYMQERRKMERELNLETDAKRKQELPALNDRLKKEFQDNSGSPAVNGTAGPSSSGTPKK